jgi:quercetin dioxygenase-like cupin family protein
VPIVKAFFIQNLNQVTLGPWERKGGKGAIINLEVTGDTDDAYVCEISPGGKSSPERHVYEELVYVLDGRGATTIWQEGGARQTFE